MSGVRAAVLVPVSAPQPQRWRVCEYSRLAAGLVKEAAAAYGRLLKLHSDDHMLVASAIVAAAECDPSSAKKYEAMLPELTSASGLDAEELEAMDPPRTKRFRDGGKVKDSMHDVDEEERAKILEARPAARNPRPGLCQRPLLTA